MILSPAHLVLPIVLAATTYAVEPPRRTVDTTVERAVASEASPTWERTLERSVPAVVAIRVTATRDFDTEEASASVGTGFVIDAERGLILTNRHMVHAGPVLAEAVFLDHEEVELRAVYRDPIHDFGIYRFDPAAVRFMDVVALDLAPEAARVGMEIRVVGNDAGEKISILDGTLARLDRNAPEYGGDTYNDWNTFYFQAASNTSGGSSGSPVLDIRGRVVALNAGGSRQAASSFYLPLDRVVAALGYIRDGKPVPRGTLQTVFEYQAYDEVRRLGVDEASEAAIRAAFPAGTGMLVVTETVPGSAAWPELQSGDVLIRVNDELVTGFVRLEEVLDANVGQPVVLDLERGGKPLRVVLTVDDLHVLTPADYLEVGRAVLNDVSFHQARNHGVPQQGVYVAVPGYWLSIAGIGEGAILTEIDGVPVPNTDALQSELEKRAHGDRVRIRYHEIDDPRHDRIAIASVDRLWHRMQRCVRDDATGMWPCTASPPPPEPRPVSGQTVEPLVADGGAARRIALSLVLVDFDVPHPTAGTKDFSYLGAGVVVDAERGLVVVDRDTAPVVLGDLMLTFAGAVRIPAEVVYLHPAHNFAVVRYDPRLLGDTKVSAIELDGGLVEKGDKVWQVGLNEAHEVVALQTRVDAVEPLRLGVASTPRFRDANIEGIDTRDAVSSIGGVLTDKSGDVVALWASFVDQASGERYFYGLPAAYITPVVAALQADRPVDYRLIGMELAPIALAEARERGLPDAWVATAVEHDPEGRRVLEVRRRAGGTPASDALRDGDLLLAVDGSPLTQVRELEALAFRDHLRLTVLRDGNELEVEIDTVPVDGGGVDRIVTWAGLIVHEPHLEVATQQGISPHGVYVAWLWYGSPGATYGLRPTRRIVEIDGTPTPDLDSFLRAIGSQSDRQAVRIKSVGLDGKVQVATLKLDLHYWPTTVIERVDGEWRRRELDSIHGP